MSAGHPVASAHLERQSTARVVASSEWGDAPGAGLALKSHRRFRSPQEIIVRRPVPFIVLALATVLLVVACSSSSGSGLTGKAWQWTASTTKVPASQSVVPDPENYTLTFNTDGSFSAKVDCNNMSGTYTTTSSGGLTITPGPMTLAACGPDSLSDIYVAGLMQAKSYAISNSQLTITLADEGTMTFK
jgi:heat shock protein HslJ